MHKKGSRPLLAFLPEMALFISAPSDGSATITVTNNAYRYGKHISRKKEENEMKRIEKAVVVTEMKNNEEVNILVNDAIATIRQAMKLEGHLYGTRVMGNHTLDVEAKIDAVYTKESINTYYDIARYDCIEELNNLVGGNVVDMTGTDKQVCRRFFKEFSAYATA